MLHIFYRICSRENNKPRPSFYSKTLCLQSLLESFKRVPDAHLAIISDGLIQKDLLALLDKSIEIIELPNVGNEHSFISTLRAISHRSLSGLIYFVEDDYLHLPHALEKLIEVYNENLADYITLFDDPLRYKLSDDVSPDLPVANELYVSKSHHWRVIESTTFTFAGRAEAIQEDTDLFISHALHHIKSKSYIMDREVWRDLQGLGSYHSRSKKRKLIGAIPSLATHCETTALSPTINWKEVADGIIKSYVQ